MPLPVPHAFLQTHSVCADSFTTLLCAGSNVTSVAEDEVIRILVLIRNFLPARDQIVSGNWDVPAVAVNSWDLIEQDRWHCWWWTHWLPHDEEAQGGCIYRPPLPPPHPASSPQQHMHMRPASL